MINIETDIREGRSQKTSCMASTNVKFEINSTEVNLLMDIKLNGSNAEKISIIIQNMDFHWILWRYLVWIT
jgi:hypothetical protein